MGVKLSLRLLILHEQVQLMKPPAQLNQLALANESKIFDVILQLIGGCLRIV